MALAGAVLAVPMFFFFYLAWVAGETEILARAREGFTFRDQRGNLLHRVRAV